MKKYSKTGVFLRVEWKVSYTYSEILFSWCHVLLQTSYIRFLLKQAWGFAECCEELRFFKVTEELEIVLQSCSNEI